MESTLLVNWQFIYGPLQEHVRAVLNIISKFPNNELILHRHFMAILSSIWRSKYLCCHVMDILIKGRMRKRHAFTWFYFVIIWTWVHYDASLQLCNAHFQSRKLLDIKKMDSAFLASWYTIMFEHRHPIWSIGLPEFMLVPGPLMEVLLLGSSPSSCRCLVVAWWRCCCRCPPRAPSVAYLKSSGRGAAAPYPLHAAVI
jgi:hypothetical protein